MEWLRRTLSTISKQLSGLSASSKILVGAMAVIALLVLFIVSQYAGSAQWTALMPGTSPADQQRAATALTSAGIKHQFQGDELQVSPTDARRAIALLAESGQLPSDKVVFFRNLLDNQRWTNSRQQNDQLYTIALQNELARVIEGFRGVKAAEVLIHVPEAQGLGRSVARPTATVSVRTDDDSAMQQGLVDAVAAFVAGSRAGLDVDRVRVIDAATGRQRRAQRDDEVLPTTFLEHTSRFENATREKVLDMLGYIPGVVVAVTASVDVTRVTSQTQSHLPERQGTVSLIRRTSETTESTSSGGSEAAEPGVMSNQTADINRLGGSGDGSRTEKTESTSEFDTRVGTRSETVLDPRGFATAVAVSVNVPRAWVVDLIRAQQAQAGGAGAAGAAPTAPTEQEIAQRFDADLKPGIIATLLPHVRAMMAQANVERSAEELDRLAQQAVSVSLIPVDTLPTGLGLSGAGSGGATLGGFSLGDGLVGTALVGALGLASLVMMGLMVKKASKKAELPSAEELVGLPPQLEAATDLIGEADEGDTAMAGIEVDERQLQSQKVLEQVGEMVAANPESAARLLNRWIEVEE